MTAAHDEPAGTAPRDEGGGSVPTWRWQLVGEDGLMVDLPDAEAVARVGAALRAVAPEGVVDVVPAARTVLVRGSARARPRWASAVRREVERAAAWGAAVPRGGPGAPDVAGSEGVAVAAAAAAPRIVEILVVYDGADLADVAALAGIGSDEVVARHAAGRYRVAFGGFMPGFAYLTGLDPMLVVPRLATPRTRVPAGAVAIAGEYAAVYPRATPGGWRLLGRTDAVMFDPAHDERPALLAPGDEVRFVPVRERAVVPAEPSPAAAPGPADEPAGAVEVIATGPLVLVEDAGRPGLAAVGVPRSGAADPRAARVANRLVGNRADAGVLEVLLGGLVVRFRGTTAIALTGAPALAEVDGRRVPYGEAVRVVAGATLELGMPASGLRTWLAVRGGIDAPPVLGSRSTDVLSGLGPAPVTAGDTLPIGHAFDGLPELPPSTEPRRPAVRRRPADAETATDDGADAVTGAPDGRGREDGGGEDEAIEPEPEADEVVVLPATPGPRIDRLDDASRRRLGEQVWTVTADSNRVALRLDGSPLAGRQADELPSEGLVLGAVQLPHDGRPVVFGADHPVTGGYPVVAVLTSEGVARAAQCRPGDRVRFVVRQTGRLADRDQDHPELRTKVPGPKA